LYLRAVGGFAALAALFIGGQMTPLIQIKTIRNALHENDKLLREKTYQTYTAFDLELLTLEIELEKEQRNLQPELPLDCNN